MLKKMREAFAMHIFFNKNIGVFQILTFEILTNQLTTSLGLNNRAQMFDIGLIVYSIKNVM